MDQVRPQQAKWRRKDDHALLDQTSGANLARLLLASRKNANYAVIVGM
jgi:hypothetical protein